MRERLQSVFARWRSLKEIEALSERDLSDIGLSRAEVIDFVQMPVDSPRRLAAMAEIFGLTEAELRAEHEAYLDLLRNCGHCGARRACSETLAHANQARPADCGFCPNAAEYAARAALKAQAAR